MLHSRMERVSSLVKAELSKIIDQSLRNPKIPTFVTVHSVKVAKDLRVADVYVTFLEDEDEKSIAEAVAELNKAAGFIRRELGRAIRLKYLPALRFHYTPATHDALHLQTLLNEMPLPKIEEDSDPDEV